MKYSYFMVTALSFLFFTGCGGGSSDSANQSIETSNLDESSQKATIKNSTALNPPVLNKVIESNPVQTLPH